jgi:hypothetical protein
VINQPQQVYRQTEQTSSPVMVSRMGYWTCPDCHAINRTTVTVSHDDPHSYTVPKHVGCRSVFCDGSFETLQPT